jgi:hypothetical protein
VLFGEEAMVTDVTAKGDALDLEPTSTKESPRRIAESLKRSAEKAKGELRLLFRKRSRDSG